MITGDSRYAEAAHEFPLSHIYDEINAPEVNSDSGNVEEVSRDTTYVLTTAQLSTPPRQYMVKETDNIQLLAYRALQDPTRWWVIANANPHIRYPFDMTMGKTIYLPE
jgi:hypothetical protein